MIMFYVRTTFLFALSLINLPWNYKHFMRYTILHFTGRPVIKAFYQFVVSNVFIHKLNVVF